MRKVILWALATAFLLGVFETAILSHIRLLPALPDLILILVVYIALYNGAVAGITAGFLSGLIFDFLSLAPMGLHSFVFTVLGFLYGILYRKYNVSRFFFRQRCLRPESFCYYMYCLDKVFRFITCSQPRFGLKLQRTLSVRRRSLFCLAYSRMHLK